MVYSVHKIQQHVRQEDKFDTKFFFSSNGGQNDTSLRRIFNFVLRCCLVSENRFTHLENYRTLKCQQYIR